MGNLACTVARTEHKWRSSSELFMIPDTTYIFTLKIKVLKLETSLSYRRCGKMMITA